jgi:predicted  nucleic acid-binding Zn-ribbon protein
MADRNHLHVCRHCGNVVATSSTTGPKSCFNCEGEDFSRYISLPEQAPDG